VAATVHALLHPDPARRGHSAASLAAHLKQLYFDILRRAAGGTGTSPRAPSHHDAQAVPLVGRDHELDGLLHHAERALSSEEPGWAVVISGDPGVGKSRLLAELTHELDLDRCATGYGRCREHGNLVSYASWRECLGQLERAIAKTSHPHGEATRAAVR